MMAGKTRWHDSSVVTFLSVAVLSMLSSVVADAAEVTTMTYEQAKQRMLDRQIPKFWIGDVDGLASRFKKLTHGQVRTIAISPGGRPIHLVTYGQKEKLGHKANFNSAIGAREPAAYMDKPARKLPVILFVGPVHGAEVEGLTGLVNFIHIMESGEDLRGKQQVKLRALGEQCRLLIIPEGNPDGIVASSLAASAAWRVSIFDSGARVPGATILSAAGPRANADTRWPVTTSDS